MSGFPFWRCAPPIVTSEHHSVVVPEFRAHFILNQPPPSAILSIPPQVTIVGKSTVLSVCKPSQLLLWIYFVVCAYCLRIFDSWFFSPAVQRTTTTVVILFFVLIITNTVQCYSQSDTMLEIHLPGISISLQYGHLALLGVAGGRVTMMGRGPEPEPARAE